MSSTRSIISPPPFAENALTVIPPTPVAGVSYRDPVAGPASSADGWPYAERVNSAEWNQIMYQISSLVSLIDKKGILGWSSAVDYTESGICFGSDGQIYSWASASGPNNGGAKDPISTEGFWHLFSAALSIDTVGAVGTRSSLAAQGASATITADQVIVQTSLSGRSYRLSGFSKVINLAVTGAGGMDIGTATANGFVGVYAIYNPTTQVSALLATMEAAAVLPRVYGGANMPAGFTASCLLSVLPISAVAGQFSPFFQSERSVDYSGASVLSGSSAIVTGLNRGSLSIPYSAKFVSGFNQVGSSAASAISQVILPSATATIGGQFNATNLTAGSSQAIPFRVAISLPQNVYQTTTNSAGTPSFTISVKNYEF